MKALREYSGLTRKEFGKLFCSKEHSVYEWEIGYCIPQLVKLINISMYFGVSLDCMLYGRTIANSNLEEMLSKSSESSEYRNSEYAGQILIKINSLSSQHRERLLGYIDALCRENAKKQ